MNITNENILSHILQYINNNQLFTDFRLVNKSIFNDKLILKIFKNRETVKLNRETSNYSLNDKKNLKEKLTIYPKDLLDTSTNEKSIKAIRELLIYKNKLLYPKFNATLDDYLSISQSTSQKAYLDENLRYRPINISSNFQPDQNVWNLSLPYKIGWSSMGRQREDSAEWIIFKTIEPIAIISSVKIVQMDYEAKDVCFGAKSVKIEIGFAKDNYHYESNAIELAHNFDAQFINIPHIVLGSYVRLTFYDKLTKWTEQTNSLMEIPTDDKYYFALLSIDFYGNNLANFPTLKNVLSNYFKQNNIFDHDINFQLYGNSYYSSPDSENFIKFIKANFIESQITQLKSHEYFSHVLDSNVIFLLNYPELKKLVAEISEKNEEFITYYTLHHTDNPKLYYRYIHDLKALFCAYNNIYLFYEGIEKLIGLVLYHPDRTSELINDMGLKLGDCDIMLSFEDYWKNLDFEIAFFTKASFAEMIGSLCSKVKNYKVIIELVKINLGKLDAYSASSLMARIPENS
jgi:hypothetical protein